MIFAISERTFICRIYIVIRNVPLLIREKSTIVLFNNFCFCTRNNFTENNYSTFFIFFLNSVSKGKCYSGWPYISEQNSYISDKMHCVLFVASANQYFKKDKIVLANVQKHLREKSK